MGELLEGQVVQAWPVAQASSLCDSMAAPEEEEEEEEEEGVALERV